MSALLSRYQTVLNQIQTARVHAKRQDEVQLITVSKTFPAADIRALYQAGQRDFGENYIQEWQQKVSDLADCGELVWHVIGNVQSNKSRAVAEHAHWLHTLDSAKLANRLNQQRPSDLPPLNVLIEINISGEASKHGIAPDELLPLAKHILSLENLNLRGLMCVAQDTEDTKIVRQQFETMQQLLLQLQSLVPQADTLSMGMSNDMALAIECGATMVRVGSAIFGRRGYTA
ncbi:YggS family pyridoxal phosphate-dependent enzyme [Neisseriaceae bacterium B1]